jgi:hypothetical protein
MNFHYHQKTNHKYCYILTLTLTLMLYCKSCHVNLDEGARHGVFVRLRRGVDAVEDVVHGARRDALHLVARRFALHGERLPRPRCSAAGLQFERQTLKLVFSLDRL